MKKIVIVGGGPAGLMVAHQLVKANADVSITILDANKAVGRKFLVAGHGGFNLSNNRPLNEFTDAYDHETIKNAVRKFTNEDTVQWLNEIGIESYYGSSGKLFPKVGIKPIQVLQAWIQYLERGKVKILTSHKVIAFGEQSVDALVNDNVVQFDFDYLIFAVGGSSWSSTGSTGEWTEFFSSIVNNLIPFQASNAGIELVNWNSDLGGSILKNSEITIGQQTRFGDIELTSYGIEGAPVYALSKAVRAGNQIVRFNFKPTVSALVIKERFEAFKGSKTDFLRSLKLSKGAIALIKRFASKDDFTKDESFLKIIHCLEIEIAGLRPMEEAISTVGGVDMNDVDETFNLMFCKNTYCVGEMLDWDAPTGGYLLQACFSSGYVCAKDIIEKLES